MKATRWSRCRALGVASCLLVLSLLACAPSMPPVATEPARASASATSVSNAVPSPTPKPSPIPRLELETPVGVLVIAGVEFMDSFPPGCSPGPACSHPTKGHRILVVWLERQDGGSIDEIRDELFSMTLLFLVDDSEAYVMGEDGSRSGLAVTHVDDGNNRFALAFAPPVSARGLQLFWPDNSPVDLGE